MQKITPFLWFDTQAEEATNFYVSIFKDSRVGRVSRGMNNTVLVSTFTIAGLEMNALNGGPMYTPSAAVSYFVECETVEEIDTLWAQLTDSGKIMMGLDKYPFSERYGFLTDKFGISWQLSLANKPQSITPCLLFVGEQYGHAEAAVKFYTDHFENGKIIHMLKYGPDESGTEGTVKHSLFSLRGQNFMAMDGAGSHTFKFSVGNSFVVNCETQEEVDRFWNTLSQDGRTDRCGWLQDQFGVSWQVVPSALGKLMSTGNASKSKNVMNAMLKMNKLDIKTLEDAYELA